MFYCKARGFYPSYHAKRREEWGEWMREELLLDVPHRQVCQRAERVGKYMIRPVLSLKRLLFDETAGRVRYQYSRNGSQEESMNYLEFIARVTAHIPDKGQVTTR